MKLYKYLCSLLLVAYFIVVLSVTSSATDITIGQNSMSYTNSTHAFSTELPINSVIIVDEQVYVDGKKVDISNEEIDKVFDGMKASNALFYLADYDFTYEISCSATAYEEDTEYDWDEICDEIMNSINNYEKEELVNAMQQSENSAVIKEYLSDSYESYENFLGDFFTEATYSVEYINGYKYLKLVYHGEYPNSYIEQYITVVGKEHFVFRITQYEGDLPQPIRNRFVRIINASELPPIPAKKNTPINNTASDINDNYSENISDANLSNDTALNNLLNNTFVRLAAFLVVLIIIYGTRKLSSGKHKKEGPVYWNPDIDLSEVPFSDQLSIRNHILSNTHNISFLDRTTALHVAQIRKPYISLGYFGLIILPIILTIVESLYLSNWWVLGFIPIAFFLPSLARHYIKSWVQIIPIAIGIIFSNSLVFFLCLDFVIARSLYDLWYAGILKAAGETLCADDELFSEAWSDSSFAIMVDGEPYFHHRSLLSTPGKTLKNVVEKELLPQDESITQHINRTINPDKNSIGDDGEIDASSVNQSDTLVIQYCNKCGQKLEKGYKYCLKCGTPIEQMIPEDNTQHIESEKQEELSIDSKKNTENLNPTKVLSENDIQQIRYWKQLMDDGIISAEEFAEKKRVILGD